MPRRWFVVALFAGLLVLLFVPFGTHLPFIHKVEATTTNFTLYANYFGWNSSEASGPNPTITVTQGDTISFHFIEDPVDAYYYPHLFLLDIDNTTTTNDCPNPGPDKCSTNITPALSPTIAPFTVSFAPGTYFYYCIYHPANMVGRFVIRASTTPDFTITANPTAIGPLNTRIAGASTITVAPTNGFSGMVTLAVSSSSGLNASISPPSIPGGSGTATLSVNSTTAGSYLVTVTGTGSPGTHSATVTVTVVMPDFKITLSSPTLTVARALSGNVMVTLTSLNGFSGTVSLISTVSPLGPQVTFSPASVAVSSSGPTTSTLSVSAMSSGAYSTPVSQGNYNVNVTGTSGSLVHSAILALTVGSSSGVGTLPAAAIIGGGIAAAVAVVAGIVYVIRRRPKTKT